MPIQDHNSRDRRHVGRPATLTGFLHEIVVHGAIVAKAVLLATVYPFLRNDSVKIIQLGANHLKEVFERPEVALIHELLFAY